MRWFLTLFLFSLLIPHLDNVPGGNLRYAFPALASLLIPLADPKVVKLTRHTTEHVLFGMLLAGAIISFLANRDPGSILYIAFMPISYVLYNYIRAYKLRRQQVYLLAGVILMACAVPRWWSGRSLMGMFGNPNNLGPLVSLAMLLVLCVGRSLPGWVKIATFMVATVIMIKTNSRAGQMGYVAFMIAYFVQAVVIRRHLRLMSLLAIFMALGIYVWMLQTGALFIITAANEFTGSEKKADFSERDDLFALYIEEVKTNPYGIGLGQSQKFTAERYHQGFSPHNLYLKIAAEGGWLFALGFFLLFCYMFLKCKSIAATSFLLGFCIRGLFESATPFTISMTSALLFLPFYLNEFSIFQWYEDAPVAPAVQPASPESSGTSPISRKKEA